MKFDDPLQAANPDISAVVKASAGVGKTYLLVTRLVRLLMQKVRPDSILAITFTRKAAAEMQSRLLERLYELAVSDDNECIKLLRDIGIDGTSENLKTAQSLYETLLLSPNQVNIQTFHSFCQSVLKKFPLEANVPPGFELVEDDTFLKLSAWDLLYQDVTLNPNSPIAKTIETLYDLTGGIYNTHSAVDNFLDARSDWWAYTQHENNPVIFAKNQLAEKLSFEIAKDPIDILFQNDLRNKLLESAELIGMHDTATNKKLANGIVQFCEKHHINSNQSEIEKISIFESLFNIFYTKEEKLRISTTNKTRAKKIGDVAEEKLLQLCADIGYVLRNIKNTLAIKHNYDLSSSWYEVGDHILALFQNLKEEQRVLDFNDLEWKTFELLTKSENAHWIQYKLDQRIDHLLIDEFQDTNPTQWNLIQPILEEFSTDLERNRSVFIVGDEKQSIYGFRRANPKLLSQANHWLENNLSARTFSMDKSRRSAKPIMDLLNSIFLDNTSELPLLGFQEHDTFLDTIPGFFELLDLNVKSEKNDELDYFRNPLIKPRENIRNPHYYEGIEISKKISALMNSNTTLINKGSTRSISYDDIMILVRSRNHVIDYETALRENKIPYISNNKKSLLECQEIKDLVALLEFIYSPYKKLALATILRSPLFSCSNENLIYLFSDKSETHGILLLQEACKNNNAPYEIQFALDKLLKWTNLSQSLPIHDFLDYIYHDISIYSQYENKIPEHYVYRVHANLKQFLSLALEIDSGRYPSLGRFIAKLKLMHQNDNSPDEALQIHPQGAVRILTIHGAKGLESPIVFLADTATNRSKAQKPYEPLINWPADSNKPTDFLVCPSKKQYTDHISTLVKSKQQSSLTEDSNLLYVALTRAKQGIVISGSVNKQLSKLSWYDLIKKSLDSVDFEFISLAGKAKSNSSKPKKALMKRHPLFIGKIEKFESAFNNIDKDASLSGTIIHRALELLSDHQHQDWIESKLKNEFDKTDIKPHLNESLSVINHKTFKHYFDNKLYDKAYNEIPILSANNESFGIVDRLVIFPNEIVIIDYKTHRCDEHAIHDIANSYSSKMNFYAEMLSHLWPKKNIKLVIIFTHLLKQVFLDTNDINSKVTDQGEIENQIKEETYPNVST